MGGKKKGRKEEMGEKRIFSVFHKSAPFSRRTNTIPLFLAIFAFVFPALSGTGLAGGALRCSL